MQNVLFNHDDETLSISLESDNDLLDFGDPVVSEQFVEEVQRQAQESTRLIRFDVGGLSRVNSALLGIFVIIHKEFVPQGVDVKVANPNTSIRKVMELTRLTRLIEERQS